MSLFALVLACVIAGLITPHMAADGRHKTSEHLDLEDCSRTLGVTPIEILLFWDFQDSEKYFMAAEPATTRRRVRSDGSWEDVGEEHLRSISEEMDAD